MIQINHEKGRNDSVSVAVAAFAAMIWLTI